MEQIIPNSVRDIIANSARYIQRFLYIRDKRGRVIPFFFNRTQVIYRRMKKIELAKRRERNRNALPHYLVLKYRQGGITTEEQGESFHLTATQENQNIVTLAHDKASTIEIFRIANLFDRKLAPEIRPERNYDNKAEIEYQRLNSRFHIGTAGNRAFGRSMTLQRAHGSEVPLWGKTKTGYSMNVQEIANLIAGLCEACHYGPVVMEGTAQGAKGWFFETWDEAKKGGNDWIPIFLPWFIEPGNVLPLERGEHLTLTAEEKDFVKMAAKNYSVTIVPEQIKWRRAKQGSLKGLFLQEHPEDDMTCFVVSGQHYFDISIINNLKGQVKPPIEVKEDGCLTIWVKPVKGHKYIIGGDVGEGLASSDYSCATVLDYKTGEQVACLHGRWKPEVFADKMAKLGYEYKTALLAPEANNHGHSTLNTLLNTIHYPRLYYHRDYDREGQVSEKLGWQTNAKTRPIMLDGIKSAVEDGFMIVNCPIFLSECRNFQDSGEGKYEGDYDDTVIAWAIAWQVRQTYADNTMRLEVVQEKEEEDD